MNAFSYSIKGMETGARDEGRTPNIHNSQVELRPVVPRVLLLTLLLLAFALRLHHLGGESLWYDETVSVHLARLPAPAMLAHTAGDIHPPGYYLLLHGWQWLTRPSLAHGLEFLFAWPSLLCGMLAVALVYPLGRRLLGAPAALLAALFAAADPFQIWYSQEVRMYTLGAALGLFCFWATLQAFSRPRAWRWLLAYALAAAAGLYTLYYFAFLLIALNGVALFLFWRAARGEARGARLDNSQFEGRETRGEARPPTLLVWLLTQLSVLLLFLPWLPIFWRQAVDPPVPPWRAPWPDLAAFARSLGEAAAALLVGQSPPAEAAWPFALLAAGLCAVFALRQWRRPGLAVLIYLTVPLALIVGLTLLVTPIYHVRYLSFVAAAFPLVSAGVTVDLWRWRRWAGAGLAALLVLAASASLRAFWTNPLYAADDHRGAVARIAAGWRPGDALLANAGWIYPVLLTYWPDGSDPSGATPPPIGQVNRLGAGAAPGAGPAIVRTGSVDGDPGLGWGDPASDFFAQSRTATVDGLAALTARHPRLWHYRLYDTVSDPGAAIRTWLAENMEQRGEWQTPGRDYGLVQLFASRTMTTAAPVAAWQPDGTLFGDALRLTHLAAPPTHTAGSTLYVNLMWEPQPALAGLPADLSLSLRLYDGAGNLVAQQDEAPQPPARAWPAGQTQMLALPVPRAVAPGLYSLELVVYRQDDGAPLAIPEGERSVFGQRYRLGTVEIRG